MTNSFYWGEKQTLLLLIIIIIIVIFIFIIFVGVDVAAGGCVRWVCPQSVYTHYSQDDAEFWLDDGSRLVSAHRSFYFLDCLLLLPVGSKAETAGMRRAWSCDPPPSVTHSLPVGSLWSGSKSTGGCMRLDVEAPGRREDANSTCWRVWLCVCCVFVFLLTL